MLNSGYLTSGKTQQSLQTRFPILTKGLFFSSLPEEPDVHSIIKDKAGVRGVWKSFHSWLINSTVVVLTNPCHPERKVVQSRELTAQALGKRQEVNTTGKKKNSLELTQLAKSG